ncbi:pregnancy-associated plasma protein-A-domain-containing protein [Coprinopsis sp. MPI-PUGE-AT-0042]|nr:pregnancy-associated plasma protein-A-domain-containing protein [Coprinopsis sp. MPI-PUGE-AT-0042]
MVSVTVLLTPYPPTLLRFAMYRYNLPRLLTLWLSMCLGFGWCLASPSFRFTKASSPQNDAPQDAQRICPVKFNPNDVAIERQLKHQVDQMKDQKIIFHPRITIPVVLHVIQASEKLVQDGYISQQQFTQQPKVLNQDFAKANITFRNAGMRRIINAQWFKGVGYMNELSKEMRRKTREGDVKTLNVWTTSFSEDDGVTMATQVFFGGAHSSFNDGRYLTHEVGHWVGLYHTFEGDSCTGPGDYVDDTPAQSAPSYPDRNCKPTDSCPGVPGLDAITSFMDYSPGCQTQFTNGQVRRMRAVLFQFRRFMLISWQPWFWS